MKASDSLSAKTDEQFANILQQFQDLYQKRKELNELYRQLSESVAYAMLQRMQQAADEGNVEQAAVLDQQRVALSNLDSAMLQIFNKPTSRSVIRRMTDLLKQEEDDAAV